MVKTQKITIGTLWENGGTTCFVAFWGGIFSTTTSQGDDFGYPINKVLRRWSPAHGRPRDQIADAEGFLLREQFLIVFEVQRKPGPKKPKSSAFLGHAASYGWDDAEQLKEWRDKKWWSIGETDHSQIRWSTSYTQSKGQMHPQTSRTFPQDPLKWIPSRNQMWQWKIPHL